MKNRGHISLKYKLWFAAVSIVVVLVAAGFIKSRNVENFFLSNYESAAEILYHDSFSEDHEAVFFLDDSGYISCALLKHEWAGYKILRTSGKLSLYNSEYLCSFFYDDKDCWWIDWGIITDDSIKSVWTESGEMKIVECKPYDYRICWLTGSGDEPQSHIEKK